MTITNALNLYISAGYGAPSEVVKYGVYFEWPHMFLFVLFFLLVLFVVV